jgi:hypothetical protein
VDTVLMTSPEVFDDLRQQQPDAARPGVHQHRVARLHGVRTPGQVVRSHALQQMAAACWSSTPSGTGTSLAAGTTAYSA